VLYFRAAGAQLLTVGRASTCSERFASNEDVKLELRTTNVIGRHQGNVGNRFMATDTISTGGLTLVMSNVTDAAIVQCRGTLTLENHEFLKRQVKAMIACNARIVLDLSELTRMDSSGLGTIVGLYLSAKTGGCNLDFVNLNKQIRELLKLSNLLSIFETCGREGIRIP
jgi:anti-sigma B factor antagonist